MPSAQLPGPGLTTPEPNKSQPQLCRHDRARRTCRYRRCARAVGRSLCHRASRVAAKRPESRFIVPGAVGMMPGINGAVRNSVCGGHIVNPRWASRKRPRPATKACGSAPPCDRHVGRPQQRPWRGCSSAARRPGCDPGPLVRPRRPEEKSTLPWWSGNAGRICVPSSWPRWRRVRSHTAPPMQRIPSGAPVQFTQTRRCPAIPSSSHRSTWR